MTVKAELKGHEFDLDALVRLLPTGPVQVIAENGAYYLVADEIDNRPDDVPFYEVAPKSSKASTDWRAPPPLAFSSWR